MPRVNPYRPHNFEYDTEASTSGAILFVSLLAAIILAAIVWASYSPSPQTTEGMTPPAQSQTVPAQPRTPMPPAD